MFRYYLNSIKKSDYEVIKKITNENIINFFSEDDIIEKNILLEQFYCLGDGLNTGFEKFTTPFYLDYSENCIYILSKDGLIYIINQYKEDIIYYYNKLKENNNDTKKIITHINNRLNFFSTFNVNNCYDNIFLKEHEIFKLCEILNNFDFEKNYLVLNGY